MRITEHFDLDVTQYQLDFVDIDTDADTPLFIDPFFLGVRTDAWSINASRTLRSFFQRFVALLGEGNNDQARGLFDHLHEPNETCLGLSRGRPRGNAIGSVDGQKLFNSISQSRAVATGVVEDLEDFRLFIDGIDKDKVSDMTTNIIRRHLVEYTKQQCALWGIPMQDGVQTGFCWVREQQAWVNGYDQALVIDGRRILLTPKAIVSYAKKYTSKGYYQHFVLEYLQHEHLTLGSRLIQHRVDGSPYVTKKSLSEGPAPYSKEFLTDFTTRHPDVFREFKGWIAATAASIPANELSNEDPRTVAQFLIDRLADIPPGGDHATHYHRTVVGILELLLYPDIVSPVVEQEIHDGRKRIDIVFDNAATHGFFFRLHSTYQTPCQFIFVECKNYSREVVNPELDQLAGRFSINRGKFGLLLCRFADDLPTLILRCRDTYNDGRGVMLPVTDDDLIGMLQNLVDGEGNPYEEFFSQRFRAIALG